ncbi:MAG: ribosomal-protein-alanine N-acetyltransferase, partial [Oscillospiraceae bacterium]|nr:ribosomal-protein-alanine N-acetyltransferase [Oscillospiraceae bacterium]
MSPVIVPFEERFASFAAEIEKACFSEPWSEQSLLSELQREDSVMFAALLDEKVIGWAGLEYVCGEGSVTNIAVLPQ